MSENQRVIKQIGPYQFLFFIEKDKFFFLSFEIIEIIKIKINLIKIMRKVTYVFENIIHFNQFGTEDLSPKDTLKTVSFLINNNNFMITEEALQKITFTINSKKQSSIVLFIYNKKVNQNKELIHKAHINNMKNRIQELLNIVSMQNQKINELKQKEEKHKILINKIGEITNNISNKLVNENYNSHKYNNSQNNTHNLYNSNNDNINFGVNKTITNTNTNSNINSQMNF